MQDLIDDHEDNKTGTNNNRDLIVEAIKRILLDIIVRGHGLRLIGRWSSEPDIQNLLERVPYLLDRLNQLHLTCERTEEDEHGNEHTHHHRHLQRTNSLHDFVQLIGNDHHWLVRTRDTLGLTPLHKAVLHRNRPIAEFILDRYCDELAPLSSCNPSPKHKTTDKTANGQQSRALSGSTSMRLIDAQDKFGRTALHYAAGLVKESDPTSQHLYKFLLQKGASRVIVDFRGKTADYYLRHPHELKSKCILQLASRKNANYQASVLSRTLKFAKCSMYPLNTDAVCRHQDSKAYGNDNEFGSVPSQDEQRTSMSVSCADLHTKQQSESITGVQTNRAQASSSTEITRLNGGEARSNSISDLRTHQLEANDLLLDQLIKDKERELSNQTNKSDCASVTISNDSLCSSSAPSPNGQTLKKPNGTIGRAARAEAQFKSLISERSDRLILSSKSREQILRSLKNGQIGEIQALVIEGFGQELIRMAPNACWNIECRRYINKIVVNLLKQVDTLHEYIARNLLLKFKSLLETEPILARIKRPYKRASMNALHLAVYLNRKSIVSHLLVNYPELITQLDSNGATCLHWAAKSLSSDRIYCWLSEHFGPRLERVRDLRNKTASDYRQQAIRLASFDQPNNSDNPDQTSPIKLKKSKAIQKDAQTIVDQNQELENELRLEGTPSRLLQRPVRPRQIDIGTTSRNAVEDRPRPVERIEIGIESAMPPIPDDEEQAKPEEGPSTGVEPTMAASREQSSADSDKVVKATQSKQEEQDERCKALLMNELVQPFDDADEQTNEMHAIRDGQTAETANDGDLTKESSFIGTPRGLGKLDENDEANGNCGMANSAVDRRQAAEVGQKQRATSNVEFTIRECLRGNNFKKLEHLILAGCGHRIQRVLAELDSMRTNELAAESVQVSDQMREFLRGQAVEFMSTIEKIHSQLHECFSVALEANPEIEEKQEHSNGSLALAPNQTETKDKNGLARAPKDRSRYGSTMNSAFHKLCNLMERSCFIVARDKFGASPVHVAIMRADKRLLDYMLRRHPEAASAPDHEGRNALHYAALVLAFHDSHKLASPNNCEFNREILITTRNHINTVASRDKTSRPLAYWPINETTQLIFDSLISRYGSELVSLRDRRGKTCQDYLIVGRPSETNKDEHRQLESGLNEPESIADCCKEYAKLLRRYDYLIWIQTKEARWQELPRTPEVADFGSANSQLNWPNSNEKYSKMDASQMSASLTDLPASTTANLEAPSTSSPMVAEIEPVTSPLDQISSNADPLLLSDKQKSPLQNAPNLLDWSMRKSNQQQPDGQLKLYDHLGPPFDERPSSSRSSQGRKSHHHGRSFRRRSVVGGVIVPTIIHDDKMDQIETYDIIYRQPPTCTSRQSSASSGASVAANLSHLSQSLNVNGRSSKSPKPVRFKLGKTAARGLEIGSGGEIASGSESTSDDEDDEDDRVERLSNEFEDRVRREKNELRTKVDQIMREIKISAKSGKSSRFLVSPNDLAALDKNANKNNQDASVASKQSEPKNKGTPQILIGQQKKQVIKSTCDSFNSAANLSGQTSKNSSSSSPSASSSCTLSNCSNARQSLSIRSRIGSCSSSSSSSTTSSANSLGSSSKQLTQLTMTNSREADKNKALSHANKRQEQDAPSQLMILVGQQQIVSKNTYGQTYLHFIASRSQSSSTLYKVLDHASHLIGERDIFYRTSRDVALQFNLPNNVQVLDKFIIDMFIGSRTTLLWLLLLQGYSPLIHVADPDGNDIMLILKLLKLDRMIQYLLQMADFQRWRDELHTFIRHGYSAGVSELSRKHRDLVRAKSVYSRTSLHLAVLFDRADMVNELLEIDQTSVHVSDNMGRTPLHYLYGLTLQNGEEIRNKLLSAGASLETRDVRMRTPKYYYIFRREIEDIRRIELELN